MGAVDLVVQIESPPSVASALQRVGRAGHQVGEMSAGVLFPKHRGDLAQTAVAVERMRTGGIEALRIPANPLDVLAQQVVAATALDDVGRRRALRRWSAAARRSPSLPRSAYDATLDLLSGRYPSDEFAELRPRIVWDRVTGTPHRPPRRAAARGHQRRHHPRPRAVRRLPGRRRGPGQAGRRARRGDGLRVPGRRRVRARRHQLADRGHHPRPGAGLARARACRAGCRSGRATPSAARPSSAPRRRVHPRARPRCPTTRPRRGPATPASTSGPPATWSATSTSSSRPPRLLPSDTTLLVERFRDELGDWRLVVHSPYGAPVHAPWALAINARLRERYGVDGQARGLRRRHRDPDPRHRRRAARRRRRGLRARRDRRPGHPGGRRLGAVRRPVPRVRGPRAAAAPPRPRPPLPAVAAAAALGGAARGGREVPVVPDRARGGPRVPPGRLRPARADRADARASTGARSRSPTSPPARRRRSPGSLLFGYVAQFVYEGDSPIAERRAAALSLDQGLLAELLGRAELRELLDPEVLAEVEAELQRLAPDRRARDAEGVVDLLRLLGPLTTAEVAARACPAPTSPAGWPTLADARRVVEVRMAGGDALERRRGRRPAARRARRAGAAGHARRVHRAGRRPAGRPGRPLRPHPRPVHRPTRSPPGSGSAPPSSGTPCSGWPPRAGCSTASSGRPASAREWCDAEVLRRLRRRSLARLRQEVEPVEPEALGRFLAGLAARRGGRGLRGVDGVLSVGRAAGRLPGARPRRSSRWCSAPGSATTSRPTSTS